MGRAGVLPGRRLARRGRLEPVSRAAWPARCRLGARARCGSLLRWGRGAPTGADIRARPRVPAGGRHGAARRGVRFLAAQRGGVRGVAAALERPGPHARCALRPVRSPRPDPGRAAGAAAQRVAALRRVDGAARRHGRRELGPLQPGAGLPVPGGRRVRRHHPHRPVPPRQPGPRVRGGVAVRTLGARPAVAPYLAPRQHVHQAIGRTGGVGAAGRRS